MGSPAVRRVPRQQSLGLYDYPRRGVPVPTPASPASRELAWCSVAQLRVRDQGPCLESRWASEFNNNSDIATGACVHANSDMPMRVGEAQGLGARPGFVLGWRSRSGSPGPPQLHAQGATQPHRGLGPILPFRCLGIQTATTAAGMFQSSQRHYRSTMQFHHSRLRTVKYHGLVLLSFKVSHLQTQSQAVSYIAHEFQMLQHAKTVQTAKLHNIAEPMSFSLLGLGFRSYC